MRQLQMLPPEAWKIEPFTDANGAPTGELQVSCWVDCLDDGHNYRAWSKVLPPVQSPPRPTDRLTYAKVGGPPIEWMGLTIFDLDTGEEVQNVVEVDTHEGWVVTFAGFGVGTSPQKLHNRRSGRFEIRKPTAA